MIINKLPEVIKCIIYNYASRDLNYKIELNSDKFIGNPIDTSNKILVAYECYYHINKLTKIKTFLHIVAIHCYYTNLPPQEILNKLQKFRLDCSYYYKELQLLHLPCIKFLKISGNIFTNFPNIVGLQELDCSGCHSLIKIPHIVGLKKLYCYNCYDLIEIPHINGLLILFCYLCRNLTEIPNIKGLQELNCSDCRNLTEIPNIKGLLKLDCCECSKLTIIPNIIGLLELDCSGCPKLTEIPRIVGLKKLFLDSPYLIKIPYVDGCEIIFIVDCNTR